MEQSKEPKQNKIPLISLIIPTYNEVQYIPAMIESIQQQGVSEDEFEVIIIDNNSKDNTYEVVSELVSGLSNFKLVKETYQGISAARNRGTNESRGRYLAFLDGDAKLPTGWMKRSIQIISDHDPDIFGGPIYPYYVAPKPDWFKDEYEIRKHYDNTGWMPTDKYLSGSNMTYKREVLSELGGFNPELGMRGDVLAYGEETVIIKRAHEVGYKLYYDLNLVVEHVVPEFKLHQLYFLSKAINVGASRISIQQDTGEKGLGYIGVEQELLQTNKRISKVVTAISQSMEKYRKGDTDLDPENLLVEDLVKEFKILGYIAERNKYLVGRISLWDKILDFNIRKLISLFRGR